MNITASLDNYLPYEVKSPKPFDQSTFHSATHSTNESDVWTAIAEDKGETENDDEEDEAAAEFAETVEAIIQLNVAASGDLDRPYSDIDYFFHFCSNGSNEDEAEEDGVIGSEMSPLHQQINGDRPGAEDNLFDYHNELTDYSEENPNSDDDHDHKGQNEVVLHSRPLSTAAGNGVLDDAGLSLRCNSHNVYRDVVEMTIGRPSMDSGGHQESDKIDQDAQCQAGLTAMRGHINDDEVPVSTLGESAVTGSVADAAFNLESDIATCLEAVVSQALKCDPSQACLKHANPTFTGLIVPATTTRIITTSAATVSDNLASREPATSKVTTTISSDEATMLSTSCGSTELFVDMQLNDCQAIDNNSQGQIKIVIQTQADFPRIPCTDDIVSQSVLFWRI
ncbi:unnamed protein product [Protopolystoma xenopodis]|uniref:Uncharacterized protein n=1 Tax=Protopolystoma xenopodis TaxID=117903 RepID=A0A3S5BLP9_9PLAT|nr:unnamed protein product [Protopolystoma xenopodis]